jgi:hypothetical protein
VVGEAAVVTMNYPGTPDSCRCGGQDYNADMRPAPNVNATNRAARKLLGKAWDKLSEEQQTWHEGWAWHCAQQPTTAAAWAMMDESTPFRRLPHPRQVELVRQHARIAKLLGL